MIYGEQWEEKRCEDLMSDLVGYMDESASRQFLCWAEHKYPAVIQKYVNEWLENDKDAKAWFEEKLASMIEDRPDNDDREDR